MSLNDLNVNISHECAEKARRRRDEHYANVHSTFATLSNERWKSRWQKSRRLENNLPAAFQRLPSLLEHGVYDSHEKRARAEPLRRVHVRSPDIWSFVTEDSAFVAACRTT